MSKEIIRLILNLNNKSLIKIFTFLFFSSILEILTIGSIIPLILVLTDNASLEKIKFINTLYYFFNFSSLNRFIIFLALFTLIFNIFLNFYYVVSRYQIEKIIWEQYIFVSQFFLDNIFKKDLIDLEKKSLGEYYSKIINELGIVYELIIPSIFDTLSKLFTILFILIFFFYISFSITTIILFFSILIFFIITKIVGGKLKLLGSKLVLVNQSRYEYLLTIFKSIKEIKLYKSNFFFINYDNVFNELKKIQLKSSKYKKISKHIIEPIFFCLTISILIAGYFYLESFQLILPIATIFIYGMVRILPFSNAILYNINNIKNFEQHLERVYPEIKDIKYIKNKKLVESDEYFFQKEELNFKILELCNINFCYPNSTESFKFNLLINKGNHYKIIGRNGSGKSTLIKVLLGLVHGSSGEYKVDQKILSRNELLKWQNFLAYVPQEVFLVNNRVINNIAYGIPENKIDKILAKKSLDIVDALSQNNEKLDLYIEIENNGSNISGGQKQKIGLARSFYLQKKIFILDESFSSIDPISKEEILKTFLKFNITLIEITHDIKSIKEYDNIVVVKKRNIFFQGKMKDFKETLF
jgi:ABC-type bacteriocin/lantibiotic exporter with double-glycine peptidase domain